MSNQYTKVQRKAIARMLSAAKNYLWDGQGEKPHYMKVCICFASTAAWQGEQDNLGHTLARRVISQRLGNEVLVEGWLRREAKVPKHLITPINVQPYRHRWVDALIKEFSQ